ncbi:helix-turn-helix domain-containing protein [Pantoea sp. SM3]|uniref:helix-turn-helix domain-containing protein n=1 Tax=Pantoea sp. SM3 TaxID=1628192 RepID=UPI0005F844C0|nr:helix-turn-helix domain-containing protein [Pantoea sp. SM3]KJV31153.1 XRE family transcriptional regulator [Pantoea sp. SM3]HAU5562546.1 helix-turn-helix domain-containing protein [Serratia fonticola]
MSPFEREAVFLDLLEEAIKNNLTHGKLLRKIRKELLGFSQERYASLAGISRRTLSDVEQDKESITLTTLNRVFKPLGLRLGLLPRQTHMMQELLTNLTQHGEPNDHS